MQFLILTAVLLPALSLAAPLDNRQAEPCAPTSYTISNYKYTSGSSGAQIFFNFQSAFSNPAIIEDASSAGATCDTSSASGTIPNENECSTGRSNLFYDLRGPQQNGDFQIIHSWRCNGQSWMSSTHHKIDPLNCSVDTEGTTTCESTTNVFAPENVRQICSTPTCP